MMTRLLVSDRRTIFLGVLSSPSSELCQGEGRSEPRSKMLMRMFALLGLMSPVLNARGVSVSTQHQVRRHFSAVLAASLLTSCSFHSFYFFFSLGTLFPVESPLLPILTLLEFHMHQMASILVVVP